MMPSMNAKGLTLLAAVLIRDCCRKGSPFALKASPQICRRTVDHRFTSVYREEGLGKPPRVQLRVAKYLDTIGTTIVVNGRRCCQYFEFKKFFHVKLQYNVPPSNHD